MRFGTLSGTADALTIAGSVSGAVKSRGANLRSILETRELSVGAWFDGRLLVADARIAFA